MSKFLSLFFLFFLFLFSLFSSFIERKKFILFLPSSFKKDPMDGKIDLIDLIDIGSSLKTYDIKKIKNYFNELTLLERNFFLKVIHDGVDLLFWCSRTNKLNWLFEKLIIIGRTDLISEKNIKIINNQSKQQWIYYPNFPVQPVMYNNTLFASAYYIGQIRENIYRIQIGYIPINFIQW